MNTKETVQGYERELKGLIRALKGLIRWGETRALIGGGGGKGVSVHIFTLKLTSFVGVTVVSLCQKRN